MEHETFFVQLFQNSSLHVGFDPTVTALHTTNGRSNQYKMARYSEVRYETVALAGA